MAGAANTGKRRLLVGRSAQAARLGMKLVTVKEVSAYLMVKVSTVYSWVHNGTIPFLKLNGLVRFDLEEIESWVRSSRPAVSLPSIQPRKPALQVDGIIRRAIDGSRGKAYNLSNGKPGLHQGLREED